MNIIVHRYNSICEPDYIDEFKAVGLNVIEDKAEMADKNMPIEKRIEILGELILKNNPLFVFTINFFPYISMICEKLNVKYVCVSVDCPVVELYSTMIRNKCNRIFLFDYKQFMDIKDENPDCIFHMPLGVNVERINKTIGEPVFDMLSDSDVCKYDVSFVGSLYNEKNDYPVIYSKLPDKYKGMCDALLDVSEMFGGQEILEQSISEDLILKIKEAADNFYPSDLCVKNMDRFVAVNNYLSTELTVRDRINILSAISNAVKDQASVHVFTRSDTTSIKECGCSIQLHGGVRSLDEMPMVFRTSRINLNPTMRSIQMGLSQRVWDVLGAGGFLLTNFQAEIPEYLQVGVHLEAYENVSEACEKVKYYLTHEEERLEIAKAGYEIAKNHNTVLQRVIEMIRLVSES